MKKAASLLVAVVFFMGIGAAPVQAQETLERSPNLSGGWVGYPGVLYANLPFRFSTPDLAGAHVIGRSTFDLSLGLPEHTLAGVRFAPESPVVPGRPDELEPYVRYRPAGQMRGAPLDVAVQTGYNVAAESIDGEITVARWVGPVRFLGAARAMSAPFGSEDPRVALAGGAVVHPLAGRLPLALSADVASLLNRNEGEALAWSVGLDVGISFTNHTLSLFATNTPTSTLQGLSRGDDDLRVGFELTIPLPVGRFAGWYAAREQALEAVVEEPTEVDQVVQADVRRYLFYPKRLEISAGTTVEWTNRDDVIHTVMAEDGAWDSGVIAPGESWRARFDEPGQYLYYCGPHPFMKGVVIVR